MNDFDKGLEVLVTQAYLDGMISVKNFVKLFDQDTVNWTISMDRETVQNLVKGIDAKITSYKNRTGLEG